MLLISLPWISRARKWLTSYSTMSLSCKLYILVCWEKNSMPRVHEASDKDLPNLRTLTLVTTGSFYQESSKLMRLGARMFMKLRQLSLYVCCMSEINLVSLMIPILLSCPLLSFFYLDLQNLSYEEGPVMKNRFSHPHPSLKQVRITGFSGKEKEIGLALHRLCRRIERKGTKRVLYKKYKVELFPRMHECLLRMFMLARLRELLFCGTDTN